MEFSKIQKLLPVKEAKEIASLFNLNSAWDSIDEEDLSKYNIKTFSKKNQNFIKILLNDFDSLDIPSLNQKMQKFALIHLVRNNKKELSKFVHLFSPKILEKINKMSYSYSHKRESLGMDISYRERFIFDYAYYKGLDNYKEFTECKSYFSYNRANYLSSLIMLGDTTSLKKIFENFPEDYDKVYFDEYSSPTDKIFNALELESISEDCLKGLKFILPYKDLIFKEKDQVFTFTKNFSEKLTDIEIQKIKIFRHFGKIKISNRFKDMKDALLISDQEYEGLLSSLFKGQINEENFKILTINYRYSNKHTLNQGYIKKAFRHYTYSSENHIRSANVEELLIEKILLRLQVLKIESIVDLEYFEIRQDLIHIVKFFKKKETKYTEYLKGRFHKVIGILEKKDFSITKQLYFILKKFNYKYQFHIDWIKTFSQAQINMLNLSRSEEEHRSPFTSENLFVLDQNLGVDFSKSKIPRDAIIAPFLLKNSLFSLINNLDKIDEKDKALMYSHNYTHNFKKGSKEKFLFNKLQEMYKKDFFSQFDKDFFTEYPHPSYIPESMKINIKNKNIKKLLFSKLDNLLHYCSIKNIEEFFDTYGFECCELLLMNEHYKNINVEALIKLGTKKTILLRNTLKKKEYYRTEVLINHIQDIKEVEKELQESDIKYRKVFNKNETIVMYHTYIIKVQTDNLNFINNRPFYKAENPLLKKEICLLNKDSLKLIKDPIELKTFSLYMTNCLLGYIKKIREGSSIIYSLERNNAPFLAIEVVNKKLHEVEYKKTSIYDHMEASKEDYEYVNSILRLLSIVN